MQVESFVCSETASEPIEATEEAVGIIEALGLEGQMKLIQKDENENENDNRNPYRRIRADELFVYGTICPNVALLKDYESGPIPLRVLQIAAHAKGFFPHLKVWYQADSVEKDPVLIGCENDYTFMKGTKDHILARWGDELESFPVLMNRALEITKLRLAQEANQLVSFVENITDADLIEAGHGKSLKWDR